MRLFGDIMEKIQLSIYLDPDVHEAAKASGLGISKMCNMLLRRALKAYIEALNTNLIDLEKSKLEKKDE